MFFFTTKGFGQHDSFRYKFIESLTKDIYSNYVSGEIARQMGDSIKYKYKTGGYDTSLNMDEFAFEISSDLRRISGDNHFKVVPLHYDYIKDSISSEHKLDRLSEKQRNKYFKKGGGPVKRFDDEYRKRTKDDMFDYGDIKILPGNIGYVEILNFESTSYFKEENKNRIPVSSVFNFFKNTHSIIIDLRENMGGLMRQAVKFCSYFSSQPNTYIVTLVSFFRNDSSGLEREHTFKKEYFTDTKITNSLIREKNIYILISNRTFSAAEQVTYNIKQLLPSVKIIGEQTKGSGNAYSWSQINKYYTATIPNSKVYDEKNANYNIQGRGITPDISTLADSAFQIAYKFAIKDNLNIAEQKIKYFKKSTIYEISPEFEFYFPDYIGDYRKISVYKNKQSLFMFYDTFKKYLLMPISKDYFQTQDFESVHFERNGINQVTEIQIKHKDGYIEKFRKK